MNNPVLLVSCDDQPGLIHRITGVLLKAGANIVSNQEFVDAHTGQFFMRTEFENASEWEGLGDIIASVLPAGADMRVQQPTRRRIVIMVSKEHHCLADILIRYTYGELAANVVAVVGNHGTLQSLAERFNVPFFLAPTADRLQEAHEADLLGILSPLAPDLLVLAKYMRVLSPSFVARWPARIINIHHSFLPAFAGGRPYHQAHARGVKLIGATAHYATRDLDEGPIIHQDVTRVTHRHGVDDLVRLGRDLEKRVLAQAVRWHLDARVLAYGNKTVVFD